MKRIRIGIDLNDVIRDFTRQLLKVYKRSIDPSCELGYEDVTEFDYSSIAKFYDENHVLDREAYNKFLYEDYAYEVFCRAEVTNERLIPAMTLWLNNTLRDYDDEEMPEVFLFSPYEMNLSIQSTFAFLSKVGIRIRELHFPTDSRTMWDSCDVMITANPNLVSCKPDGKTCLKIDAPYNKEVEADHTFNSMLELIQDKDETLIKIIEKYNSENGGGE